MLPSTHWHFITNHAVVLLTVWRQPDITVRVIAERAGITERAVHRILTDLSRAGYLIRERVGRRSRYSVSAEQPMRHPAVSHLGVDKLLAALDSTPKP